MNLKSKTALAVLALMGSTAAFAQAAPAEPANSLTYNIGAVSDYRFRGITQTNNQPSFQGGVDFAHKSGLYVGAWAASNIKWVQDVNGASSGTYELDLYGGYKAEIMPDLSYDIGLITYRYPGNNSGDVGTLGFATPAVYTKADTNEFYGALTYKMVTVKYSQSMGDFLGNANSGGSRYVEAAATFDLGNGYSLTPHVGRQTIPNQVNNVADYNDYSLALAKDFGNGIVVSGTAYATSANTGFYSNGFGSNLGRELGKNGAAIGVKYSF